MNSLLNRQNENSENDKANKQLEFGYYAEISKYITAHGNDTLAQCIQNILSRLGFTHYSFINTRRAEQQQTTLTNMPDVLIQRYYEQELFKQDMIVQCSLGDSEPFFSSTIYDYLIDAPFSSDMTRCMNHLAALNKEFGFNDCYHIPVSEQGDTQQQDCQFLLTVAIKNESKSAFNNKALNANSSLILLAEAIAHTVTHITPELLPENKPEQSLLNPKPLRVLNTLANSDMTIEQIAGRLCISAVTANNHLKQVRNSLGVKTNYAAIRRAVLLELIKLDSTPKHTN